MAMVMMAMSTYAQSNDNNVKLSFGRLANYLELTTAQYEPVKLAMAQFNSSMDAYYQVKDASKGAETWEKIQARHKANMKKVLNEKQYDKYVKIFDSTVKNAAEDSMTAQQTAGKQIAEHRWKKTIFDRHNYLKVVNPFVLKAIIEASSQS